MLYRNPVPSAVKERTPREFWSHYQPGFRVSDAPVGSAEFFAEVEHERYLLEPDIIELAQFESWRDQDVLEPGCGTSFDLVYSVGVVHHVAEDRQRFLNLNTDGPGNPVSKVYGRDDVRALFAPFQDVRTAVRFLHRAAIRAAAAWRAPRSRGGSACGGAGTCGSTRGRRGRADPG